MKSIITPTELDGDIGFSIIGPSRQTGWGITDAGDVNGDGRSDLIISSDARNAFVVYGGGSFGAVLDLATLDGSNGFRFVAPSGSASDNVAGIDINHDGLNDVVIGKSVIFGSAGLPARIRGASLGGYGFPLPFGPTSIAALGDFDGDGIDDLALAYTSHETAYLRLSTGTMVSVAASSHGMSFAQDVASAGDFNGDGLADFIVSANLANMVKGHAAGAAYVIFGTINPPSTIEVSALDGTNGLRIDAAETASRLSWSMGNAGDVNGDGFDDIIVQATDADPGVWREGTTYIVFGHGGAFPPTFDLELIDGTNGVRIDNVERRGQAMSAATGDFNGDGFADIAIGAPDRTPEGKEYGPENAYVVFGRPDWQATIDVGMLDGSNGFRFDGGVGRDDLGRFVRFSDVNADGFDDLVVSAPRADGVAGAVHVIYGHATGPVSPFVATRPHVVGTAGNNLLRGTATGETFDGLAGNDIMRGGSGGGDQYRGGAGFDSVIYGEATAAVAISLAQGAPNTGAAAGDTFLSIEKIVGSSFRDSLRGDHANGRLEGGEGNDRLTGLRGNDHLVGGKGDDLLIGGEGADVVTGSSGADRFLYNAADSTVGFRDTIMDFETGIDRIDLHRIDANLSASGDQAFSFIGNAAFHGIVGELRSFSSGSKTLVEADITGNGQADFSVTMVGNVSLSAADFVP